MAEVQARTERSFRLRVSGGFVEAALAERPDVQWLGTPAGAFWYGGTPGNPLIQRVLKIVDVAGCASIDEIAGGLHRSAWRGAVTLEPDQLLKPATALMFLRTSPSFIRVLRGFYGLRGRPWLAFFVTRSWRAGGLFPVPPALETMIEGPFDLRLTGGRTIGQLRPAGDVGVGLLGFYQKRRVQPKDAVAMIFDPTTRTARGGVSRISIDRARDAAANAPVRISRRHSPVRPA